MPVDWSQFSDAPPTSQVDDVLNSINSISKIASKTSSSKVDWSQFSNTPPPSKGKVDWSQFSDNAPESSPLQDVLSGIDNASKIVPKSNNIQKQKPLDMLSSKVNSYADINTHGLQYPERTLTDVLTGRMGTPQEVQNRVNEQYANMQHQDDFTQDASDEVMPGFGFIPKGGIELAYLGDAVKSGALSKTIIKQHEPLLKAVQSGDVSAKVASDIIKADPKVQQAIKSKSFTDIIAGNVAKEQPPIEDLINKHLVDMGEEPHFKTSEALSPIQEEVNPLDNPRLNELLDMRENVSAKDARSPQVIDKKGGVVYNNDIGNTTSFEYPSYSKNYNYDFKITKNDVRDIRNGTANPTTLEKLKSDLDTLDNHPDYMKEEPIGMDGSPLFSKGEDYRGWHKAPQREEANSGDNLTDIFPDDIYSNKAVQYYGTGNKPMDEKSVKVIQAMRNKPDAKVTIYRAVPKGVKDINAGDWVTTNKDYAKWHGSSWVENGQYDIISKEVKSKDIHTNGDSIHEWGYNPQSDILMSKGTQGSTTTEAIHQSAKKLLGKNYDNLKGDINIVQSYKDLPKGLVDNGVEFSSGGKVRGIFNPKDGKVHLVADAMKPEEVNGVLVHELLHKAEFSGEKILGESHDTLVLRLKQLKDEPLVKQAFKSAKDAGTDAKNINREMMSYLVEKYQLGIDMSPKLKQFVRNIIDAVKVFVSKTAVKLGVDEKWLISKMNEKDIAALLKSSAIKQEVKEVSKETKPMMSISNNIKEVSNTTPYKEQVTNAVDKVTETLQDYWKPAEKILLEHDKKMAKQGLLSFDFGQKVNDARKAIYGRTGERIALVRDTQQILVDNISKYAKQIGEDIDSVRNDLNSFLIAQHAPERNKAIRDSAAGISTRSALKSLIELRKNDPEKYKVLSGLANDVRKLNNQTLDILKDGQIITPELYDTLRAKYKNHVPLQRIMPEDKEAVGSITGGKGFSVKSTGIKVAKGSDLEVSDILGNVSANVQEAIIRAEKNRVGLAMWDMFKADKTLGEARGLRMVGKDLKDIPLIEQPTDDMIVLYKDGKKKVIIPNDPIIAKVYNQLNVEERGIIANTIAPVTRTIAGLYTRFNPEFALSNIVRDMQEAFVYNAAEMSGKDAIGAVGNQAWAVKAVTEHMLGKATESTKLYAQMKLDGGTTGGITLANKTKITKDVDDMFKLAGSKPRQAVEKVFQSIDNYNTIFEDSTRLAAYKQALDKGLSRERAAIIAKETTIDFNRKGTATPWVNAVYMFSNASIQGSYKMIRAFKNPKVLASTVGIITATSAAIDSHNDTVDPDWRDKVNQFERTSNYVILLDSKDGELRRINIPIGWGFKPIKTMVESLRDVAVGKSQGNPIVKVIQSIGQSYMPINGRDVFSALTPSVLNAFKDVHDNTNWKGQMISPKGMDLANPSDKYFPTTPETLGGRLAIKLVQGTEKIGLDLTPEDIKYLTSTYGGGPLNFSTGIFKMLESSSKGEDIKPEDMVMARRFYKETNPERLQSFEGKQSINKMIEKVQKADNQDDRLKIIQEELPKLNDSDKRKAISALKYGGLLPNKQSVVKESEKAQWDDNILNPFQSKLNTKK